MQFPSLDTVDGAPPTVVIADDLSGAAECAAEFTPPGGSACLRLAPGPLPAGAATVVWDLDTRDTAPDLRPQVTASIASSRRTYLKIDSLLRGNWPALVAALVHACARPALLCPALPRLHRGLRDGCIDLPPASGLVHHTGSAVEALRQAGVAAGHHRLAGTDEAALREGLRAAMARHPVTVVDAGTDAELDAMARALESLHTPYVAIGSAGLAGALARALAIPAGLRPLGHQGRMAVLVGSLTGPAREQLSQLAGASGQPLRWWDPAQGLQAVPPDTGAALHLYATRPGEGACPAGRTLTCRFVRDVLAHAPAVDAFVATGGETARALCDALGLDHLDILGQVEPGVSLARLPAGVGAKYLIIKSGSFGDPATLTRIAHMGGVLPVSTEEIKA